MGDAQSRQIHNTEVLDSLLKGDMIEFSRGLYSHWGIYYGDGKVIHLTGIDNEIESGSEHSFFISWQRFPKATVKIEDFFKVCGDSCAKKNNQLDGTSAHLDVDGIIERALRYLDKNMPYNLIYSNCEHFSHWCRYGMDYSKQAVTGISSTTAIIATGAAAAIAAGCVYAYRNRNQSTETKKQ